MTVEDIAAICHEANRMYCVTLGDTSQQEWMQAPEWQKESAKNGVRYHLQHPYAKPSDSHENWLREKIADGWRYGPIKDVATKTHPCCIPYGELPPAQQLKDTIFVAIVRACISVVSVVKQ